MWFSGWVITTETKSDIRNSALLPAWVLESSMWNILPKTHLFGRIVGTEEGNSGMFLYLRENKWSWASLVRWKTPTSTFSAQTRTQDRSNEDAALACTGSLRGGLFWNVILLISVEAVKEAHSDEGIQNLSITQVPETCDFYNGQRCWVSSLLGYFCRNYFSNYFTWSLSRGLPYKRGLNFLSACRHANCHSGLASMVYILSEFSTWLQHNLETKSEGSGLVLAVP